MPSSSRSTRISPASNHSVIGNSSRNSSSSPPCPLVFLPQPAAISSHPAHHLMASHLFISAISKTSRLITRHLNRFIRHRNRCTGPGAKLHPDALEHSDLVYGSSHEYVYFCRIRRCCRRKKPVPPFLGCIRMRRILLTNISLESSKNQHQN